MKIVLLTSMAKSSNGSAVLYKRGDVYEDDEAVCQRLLDDEQALPFTEQRTVENAESRIASARRNIAARIR